MMTAILVVYVAGEQMSKSISTLESFLLAGGVGDLIDRMLRGYVVDFMNMGIGTLRVGIFNVADISVTIGGLLLLLSTTPVKKIFDFATLTV